MKQKYYVLILAILLIVFIAIGIFVGRNKPEETANPKGQTEQNEQVDDEGIMEDEVFEEDDSTEENKESQENIPSEIPSDSGEKDPTQDAQDGSGEESSEGDSGTEQPEDGSVELPRVPLN